jgi:uncharacterized protein (TIGR02996 family)
MMMPNKQLKPIVASFLEAIASDPSNADLQLVYGDWLEEQGLPEQAEFIRLVARAEAGDAGVFGGDLAIDFRWCPAGTFTMGSPEDEEGHNVNEVQVEVTLSRGYWMGRTVVTQALFERVLGIQPWSGESSGKQGSHYPATHVSWEDSTEFCRKLTDRERLADRLPERWEYRLPTDAEWEYAARAGTTLAYSCGSDALLGEYAWYDPNASSGGEPFPHEVGLKMPNPWGLYDVHGNVWEWCSDYFRRKLTGGRDPKGSSEGRSRVSRGGSWHDAAGYCRSAYRGKRSPSIRPTDLGFRLALSLSGE